MENELVVNLYEVPEEEGIFCTKNLPGEKFRSLLVDRGSQLHCKVSIVNITHGGLAEGDDLATLLVFEFEFLATSGRRFKAASVTLQFKDSEGKMVQDPVVHAISPNGKLALNKTEKKQNIRFGVNASINAGSEVARGEVGMFWEVEESKKQEFYTALTGSKRNQRRMHIGEDETVKWTLEENKDKKDGIPTFMRAAVLLRRPENVPFTFTVNVKTDVDFLGQVKTLCGLGKKDPIDPAEVDPRKSTSARRQPRLESLDPQIHNLNEMSKFDLHQVADVRVATVLDGGWLLKHGDA
jgi:hypothetical protein